MGLPVASSYLDGFASRAIVENRWTILASSNTNDLANRASLVWSPALYCVLCPRLNAFAVSNRQEGGIAVMDGMLRTLSYREIRAFLAHKMTHLQHNDVCILLLSCIVGKRVDLVGDCCDFISVCLCLGCMDRPFRHYVCWWWLHDSVYSSKQDLRAPGRSKRTWGQPACRMPLKH